jgi:hypothetical protein
MTPIDCEKRALDYVGGFEAVQGRLYSILSQKIVDQPVSSILFLEDHLPLREMGFKKGLVGFLREPVYITHEMIESLAVPLNINEAHVFPKFNTFRSRLLESTY